MDSPVMQVRDLVKEFGGFRAVDGLTLDVGYREVVGLLGPNGAGKTTAMNMMLGLTTPTSGSIEVFGRDLHKHRVEILKRLNFSSAYTNLPGNLTVEQNLTVFGHLYEVPKLKKRINEVIELFDIAHLRKRTTGHLSAGEGTRVNLCKAFLNSPDVLLLDEPTASLDPDIADKVRKIIVRIREESDLSIIYTSHNMRDIDEVCDRVIFLHHGRVIREGTPVEIKESFAEQSLEDVFIRIARGGDLVERSGEGRS